MRTGGAGVYDPNNGRVDNTRILGDRAKGRCKHNTMTENDSNNGPFLCPVCGKPCKTQRGLGQHVARTKDHGEEESDTTAGIPEKKKDPADVQKEAHEGGAHDPRAGSDPITVDGPTPGDTDNTSKQGDWVELDPSDNVDRQLIEQGYSEVKREAIDQGQITEGDLR